MQFSCTAHFQGHLVKYGMQICGDAGVAVDKMWDTSAGLKAW